MPPPFVDTSALVNRLSKGDVTFITDHPEEMPEGELAQINGLKNCVIYPAIGFLSDEARIAKQEIFIANVEGFLSGKIQNKVN